MKYVEYKKIIEDLLKSDTFFRHLFNKAVNKRIVKIKTVTNDEIVGILKSVDAYFRGLELVTNNGIYYINWRNVVYIKVKENE